MSGHPPMHYIAEPADALLMRPLADIMLIHHRRSGQTHMVASPVPELLAVVGAAPAGIALDAILAALSVDYDLGDPGEAALAIAAHLEELAALGLIHCA